MTIDHVREFWDAQPCDSTLENYDKYISQHHILKFAKFEESAGKKVLEIGCGIGMDTLSFAIWRARVTAVDLSPASLNETRERLIKSRCSAELIEANAEELSKYLEPQPFDIIYSFGVIHHTPNPERVFQELLHYCYKETELRIMLYAKWSLRSLYIILFRGKCRFWKLSEILRRTAETQTGCPVAYFYTFKEVRELMKGYEIICMEKAYLRGLPKFLNFVTKYLGAHILITARPND